MNYTHYNILDAASYEGINNSRFESRYLFLGIAIGVILTIIGFYVYNNHMSNKKLNNYC